ncbi:MAG: hypothetical protein ACK4TR_13795 [Phenylobacterium sp.]|uniref:hypothetical protein n=1 Tax=Phenylobacterium sp. TaxID=1871053 RepID=UPI003919F4DA
MKIVAEEIEIEILHTRYRGREGWWWHEIHRPPVGPFPSAAGAFLDITARVDCGDLKIDSGASHRRDDSPLG